MDWSIQVRSQLQFEVSMPSRAPKSHRQRDTDVKLDNIFVNYGQNQRFSTIQLGDCGGVVSENSDFAKEGHLIGAGFTRSPEATFQLPWGTATDIWSFGNAVRRGSLPMPKQLPIRMVLDPQSPLRRGLPSLQPRYRGGQSRRQRIRTYGAQTHVQVFWNLPAVIRRLP